MSDDIKYADIGELRELGVLHEINRLLLHPLGLALEVKVAADGTETLGGVWDYRDDAEGIYYGADLLNSDKASRIAYAIEATGPGRIARLGYVIQPVSPDVKQLHLTVREPFIERLGPAGEYDEGEERP